LTLKCSKENIQIKKKKKQKEGREGGKEVGGRKGESCVGNGMAGMVQWGKRLEIEVLMMQRWIGQWKRLLLSL
jgi:hypothetical protein